MKFTVERYNDDLDFHECRNLETGDSMRLDLYTDDSCAGLPQDKNALVGKVVEVEETWPYISFGHKVQLSSKEPGA